MTNEDFFAELDNKLRTLQQQREVDERRQRETAAKAPDIFVDCIDVTVAYQKELRQRNIKTALEHDGHSFTFRLYYANGGYLGLRLTSAGRGRGVAGFSTISVEQHSYAREEPREGPPYTDARWSRADFVALLQEVINDFLQRAPQNGGIAPAH